MIRLAPRRFNSSDPATMSSSGEALTKIDREHEHVALSELLRERNPGTEVASKLVAEDDTPDVAVQKQDKSAKIRACIDELSADHRTVLDLVYYQEQSVAEVAAVLGIPEATVKTRMFYARRKLSELLLARGIDRGWP